MGTGRSTRRDRRLGGPTHRRTARAHPGAAPSPHLRTYRVDEAGPRLGQRGQQGLASCQRLSATLLCGRQTPSARHVAVYRLPTPVVVTTATTMVGVIAVATAVSHQPWMLGKSLVAGVLVASEPGYSASLLGPSAGPRCSSVRWCPTSSPSQTLPRSCGVPTTQMINKYRSGHTS